MRPATPQRQNVMHFRGFGQPSFLTALFAQRVRRQEPGAYPFPFAACVHSPCRLVPGVPIVLPVSKFLMLFAVSSFRQPGAAGKTAWSPGFPWQCHHLRMLFTTKQVAQCYAAISLSYLQRGSLSYVVLQSAHLIYNVAACPMLHRNLPVLLTRWQLIQCHACLCPACWQHRHVSGHRKSPRKIHSPAGRSVFCYYNTTTGLMCNSMQNVQRDPTSINLSP